MPQKRPFLGRHIDGRELSPSFVAQFVGWSTDRLMCGAGCDRNDRFCHIRPLSSPSTSAITRKSTSWYPMLMIVSLAGFISKALC